MSADEHGRLVVVTGAGAGMGRAIATWFCERGDRVIAADVDEEAARGTLSAAKGGEQGVAIRLDVSDAAAVTTTMAELAKEHGPVEVLVNNAGVMDGFWPAGEVPEELWQRVLSVNLSGPEHMARAVLGDMAARGKGAIVNIASIAALSGGKAGAAYTASKHGLIGLTKHIAWQYGPQGIRANAVCPGAVATSITANRQDHEGGRARADGLMALRLCIGQPEEVASIVGFLSSDDAALVNGSVVMADGGWLAG